MSMRSNVLRRYYFFKYNTIPFRFNYVFRHAYKRLLPILGLNKKGFRIIDLSLTFDCNFNCEHCSALIMKRSLPTLTLNDYKGIVKSAKRLDVLSWNITGGEPLIVEWIDELIPILEPQNHFIAIQTNCSLLTEARAMQLSKLGVNCITTSLDSFIPAEHDKFRKSENSYQKVLQGIKNARKAGMQALVGIIVTHQNLRSKSFTDLIELINRMGAICLFNLAVPCGKWKNNNDIILRGDDRQYLEIIMERYPMTSTDHEVGRNALGCPAGMEKIYITPYGEVTPCPFIHISFGNVREQPLQEIINNMREIKEFSEYQNICIAAEDRLFHKNVFSKIYSSDSPKPIDYRKIYE